MRPPAATRDLRPDLCDRSAGVQRHELAGGAVVLDDRLRLGVVDLEPVRDHLGRVVGAALQLRALEAPVASRPRRAGRRRGSRRAAPDLAQHPSSASACARLRGKPSSTKPSCASGCDSRSSISAIVTSSGTSRRSPGSARPACRARCPRRARHGTCRRVETCGISYSAAIRFACVPLPAPCGPRTSRFTAGTLRRSASSSATPSGASCRARRRRRSAPRCRRARATWSAEAEVVDEDRRQHRDGGEEQRARQRQPRQDRSRYCAVGGPGRMPGMKPPYLRRLSAWSTGLNCTAV